MDTTTFAFELGCKVRDIVTGHEGIVTGRHEYLNRCIRYSVQAPAAKKGEAPPESFGVDEEQLERVGQGVIEQAAKAFAPKLARTGGPRPTPHHADRPR